LELDKILPALDLGRLLVGEPEADFTKRGGQCAAILPRALDKEIRVLGRVGEAEENRAGFSDEQIAHAVALEGIPDLLRLAVFKRSHSQPGGKGLVAPAPVLLRRLERSVRSIVQHRLVRANERVPKPNPERPPGGRLEFLEPLSGGGDEVSGATRIERRAIVAGWLHGRRISCG